MPGMDGSIVGRCRFGLKTYSVLIFKDTKYVDLCSQICSQFKELNSCEMEMTYAIGNH
ncbi:hypothetical protein PRUPE_1G325400 [Prunus persica]|uniref:Uncharacterized protein n=1 Tax=Prunus persica TaxID=3760 RepID=A0A251R6M6_PRUPE|nr:hypothetical protein PRUPE_1G325400 [Prunus persica]ONI31693.1 hypothetical protein PRUPE_1G325400 [Prunus persica]ONI31694.1 hypothetical protein PRUPE_1G325400 [Prunus persica]